MEEAVSLTKPYPERLHSMPDVSTAFICRLVLVDLVRIDVEPVEKATPACSTLMRT